MILGIGIDILDHSHIASWDEAFYRYTFSEAELAEGRAVTDPNAYFAGRFCVKEAVIKALNGFGNSAPFTCIETLAGKAGVPQVKLVGEVASALPENTRLHVSISHEKATTIAFVVAENVSD